jgi:DNA polymerase sigma
MEEEFVPFEGLGEEAGGSSHALMTEHLPWLPNISAQGNENPLLILHCEIVHFSQLMSLSEAEMANREDIIEEVKIIALKLFPGCQVHPFGSHVSKILTPKSDIDIVSHPIIFSSLEIS